MRCLSDSFGLSDKLVSIGLSCGEFSVRFAGKLTVRQSDGFLGIGEVELRVFVQQFQAAFTIHFRSNQVDVGAGA